MAIINLIPTDIVFENVKAPDGVAFNPATGNVFSIESELVGDPTDGLQPSDFRVEIKEYTAEGVFLKSFDAFADELVIGIGLSILPNGNLLTPDVLGLGFADGVFEGRIVEISSVTGEIVEGGIDIQSPDLAFILPTGEGTVNDPTGIRYTKNDTIVFVNFVDNNIVEIAPELDANGDLIVLNSLDMSGLGIDFPAAVEIDPVTGNFLVADEIDGTNSIYEITSSGDLVRVINMGDLGFEDPEGLTIDPMTRTLYIAFDDDSFAGKEFTLGDRIVAFEIEDTPTKQFGGNGEDILFGGSNNDRLDGGKGEDKLFGAPGDDKLFGGKGADLLNGGLGHDTLTGCQGDDTFVLAVGEGTDTITDFGNGDDVIGLSGGLVFGVNVFQDDNAIVFHDGVNQETLAFLKDFSGTLGAEDFVSI